MPEYLSEKQKKLPKGLRDAIIAAKKAKEKKEKSLQKNGVVHSPLLAENLRARNARMKKMMSTKSLNDYDDGNRSNGCC